MKNWAKWVKRSLVVLLAVTLILPTSIALANWLGTPATIVSDLADGGLPASTYGITMQPDKQTFYAAGRHWIFYINDDSDFVYKTALTNGVFGAETELVAITGIYGFEMGVWYDKTNNKVHYARHSMNGLDPDTVNYRMGTPNADGTITWAAVEQTVAIVPADLLTWRTFICVDEDGYPWVGYIDTDGVNTFGLLYVESSSTKNGTWTEDVTQRFGAGGIAADGTGTMTGSPVQLDIGLNQPTVTVAGTFTITLPIGCTGTAATGGWVITGSPVALTEGVNTITVELGGAGTIDITVGDDDFVWFGSITPIGTDSAKVEVQWSCEDISGNVNGLYASVYDTGTGWSTRDTVVAEGSLSATRPDAFSFHDIGSAMYVVYTASDGTIQFRVRSQIQTWLACAAAVQIKDAGATERIPTLSGYSIDPTGEDLICIVHENAYIWYNIMDFSTDTWWGWIEAWHTPVVADDVISRHIAAYTYGSPMCFAWQWNDLDTNLDTVNYWWIDQDQLGYYTGGLPDVAAPLAPMILLVFLGLAILVLLGLAFSDNINLKMLVYMAIAIMIILAFVAMMNGQINAF